MSSGSRRRRRHYAAVALAAVLTFPGAIVAASPAGEPAPRAAATARITLVVPDADVRRQVARHCRQGPQVGYVPVVHVDAGATDVPAEGEFVRCRSGDTVFVLPRG